MRETYGYPFLQVHRADLHAALKKAALDEGTEIRTKCNVVDFDFNTPSITLESGEVIQPDFVVAADG